MLQALAWLMRAAAIFLVPGAIKAMLVTRDMGASWIEAVLVLIAALVICAGVWTVGEVAAAVRDIGRRLDAQERRP